MMKLETVLQTHQSEQDLSCKLETLDRICGTIHARQGEQGDQEDFCEEHLFEALMDQADDLFETLISIECEQDDTLMYYAEKLEDLNERARSNLNVYLLASHMEKILDSDYQKPPPKEDTWH